MKKERSYDAKGRKWRMAASESAKPKNWRISWNGRSGENNE